MNGLYIDYTKLRAELSFSTVLNFYNIDYPADKNQVKVVCPFHDESTASCSINLEEKKFRCFGCNTHGNCLEFVIFMEGLDPKEKSDFFFRDGFKRRGRRSFSESVCR